MAAAGLAVAGLALAGSGPAAGASAATQAACAAVPSTSPTAVPVVTQGPPRGEEIEFGFCVVGTTATDIVAGLSFSGFSPVSIQVLGADPGATATLTDGTVTLTVPAITVPPGGRAVVAARLRVSPATPSVFSRDWFWFATYTAKLAADNNIPTRGFVRGQITIAPSPPATAATLTLAPPPAVPRQPVDQAGQIRYLATADGGFASAIVKTRPASGPPCAAVPDADPGREIFRQLFFPSLDRRVRTEFPKASGRQRLCGWVVPDGAPGSVLAAAAAEFVIDQKPVRVRVRPGKSGVLRVGTTLFFSARVSSAFGKPEGYCVVEQRVGRRWVGGKPGSFRSGRPCVRGLTLARAGTVRIRMRYLPYDLGDWAPGAGFTAPLTVLPRRTR